MIKIQKLLTGFFLGKRAGTQRENTADVSGFFFEVCQLAGGLFARGEELGGIVRLPEPCIPLQNSKKKEVGAVVLCENGNEGTNEVFK